jgi:hypothetical protein
MPKYNVGDNVTANLSSSFKGVQGIDALPAEVIHVRRISFSNTWQGLCRGKLLIPKQKLYTVQQQGGMGLTTAVPRHGNRLNGIYG